MNPPQVDTYTRTILRWTADKYAFSGVLFDTDKLAAVQLNELADWLDQQGTFS